MGTPEAVNHKLPGLSDEALRSQPSAIRDILKLTQKPGIISFAGGLPATGVLPADLMSELLAVSLRDFGPQILNYGTTEGFEPFREVNRCCLSEQGVVIHPHVNEMLINSGAQQTIELVGRVLINPGDYVMVERPTYLGAFQALAPRRPKYLEVETDDQGIKPESLDDQLSRHRGKVKLLYVVPDFQNPTGITTSWERRIQIAQLAEEYGFYVLEDNPYGRLRYEGKHIPPIQSLFPEGTVYAQSYSKILAPTLRLAAAVVPISLADKMVEAKQGSDLCTGNLQQAQATVFVRDGYLRDHLEVIRRTYQLRRDVMFAAMDQYFPTDWSFSRPQGGMFIWAEGPADVDTKVIFQQAIDKGVAFVPGEGFFVNGGHNTMRLNFSYSNEMTIVEGMQRLADTFAQSAVIYSSAKPPRRS